MGLYHPTEEVHIIVIQQKKELLLMNVISGMMALYAGAAYSCVYAVVRLVVNNNYKKEK